MVDLLGKFFVSIFGTHAGIATVIISMFPLIELKGGIPVGMSSDFWGEYALNGTASFLLAMLGSCLVVPIVAVIFKPIVEWLKRTKLFRKIGHMIDSKVKNHSESFNAKAKEEKSAVKRTWAKILFVFSFVAIPLPLTGVWTGTCVAVAIGLNFWQTCLSCILGNMVAGLIIVTVCSVFPEFTTILFLIFLLVIIAFIVYSILKRIIKNRKSARNVSERIIVDANDVKVSHPNAIQKENMDTMNNISVANTNNTANEPDINNANVADINNTNNGE